MTFKTVHGLGRNEYAIRAFNVAMDKALNPSFVDAWVEWFNAAPADKESCPGVECERNCGDCVPFGVKSQCDHCQVTTICPDDCPQPEFYLGDLEEVAHAASKLAIEIAVGAIKAAHPMHISCVRDITRLLGGVLDEVNASFAAPGYVEGLIPE